MAGVYKRVLDLNPLALLIPCNNHSLSFVGVYAAPVNVDALTFFSTVERPFGYFLCSAHGCCVLKDSVSITVTRRHSDTRWSSEAAAVRASSRHVEA
jgi:hypothetical protein